MKKVKLSCELMFGCVASTFTVRLGCGHFGIQSTVELCRFCVLSLHKEVDSVRQYTR